MKHQNLKNEYEYAGSNKLTEQEMQILALLCEGKTHKQIGIALDKTESMIRNYFRAIFDKTGMSTRLEVAIWYETKYGAQATK